MLPANLPPGGSTVSVSVSFSAETPYNGNTAALAFTNSSGGLLFGLTVDLTFQTPASLSATASLLALPGAVMLAQLDDAFACFNVKCTL